MNVTPHPYIPNSAEDVKKELMEALGIDDVEELYQDIPQNLRLKKSLNLPSSRSELEVRREVNKLLSKNLSSDDIVIFLGGGCWPHYVPAAVSFIVKRTELLTSYTPYQAEVSQGLLQILFEYQSMICELTGMDVANASMYDWATAAGEAARMAARYTGRRKVLVPSTMSPRRLSTIKIYCEPSDIQIEAINYDGDSGQIDIEDLKGKVSDETAAVYIENPSYLGFVETEVEAISQIIHDANGLFIVGVDPISLGVLKPPDEYGADIVVGEGQSLGNPMNYGGPLLGIFACRDDRKLIRQMPGRIIGMTETLDGEQRAFCMALQTREQHIRRERATSNICTNHALCAVSSAVYLALLGPRGLRELGMLIMERSQYAMDLISKIDDVKAPIFNSPHFKEFTVNFDWAGKSVQEVNRALLKYGIHGGIDLSKEFPEFGETALYCVTEIHSVEDVERLAKALSEVLVS